MVDYHSKGKPGMNISGFCCLTNILYVLAIIYYKFGHKNKDINANNPFLYFFDNISDKTYVTDVFHADWQTGDVLSFYQGASRQVYAGIRYNF